MAEEILSKLAQRWQKIEESSPDIAEKAIELVDDGDNKSLDFYLGMSRGLTSMGLSLKDVLEQAGQKSLYLAMLCYSAYKEDMIRQSRTGQ